MNGRILKILNNDLYGNVDDRRVSLFAAFMHKKYMNKYAIFTYTDEYNKNKLYCSSVHLKDNSIVTFGIRNEELAYVNKFVDDYLNNKVDPEEFEILDLGDITKIELVSNTPIDCDKLIELDKLSIPRTDNLDEDAKKAKKPVFLYILLVISILFLAAVIYIHYNPDILSVKLNQLTCEMSGYDKKLNLPYTSEATIKFDRHNELASYDKIDTYTFNELVEYLDFKDNNKESTSFDITGSYKYDDDNLTLKIIYEDELIIYKYEEVFRYLKKEGYSCTEGVYYE